MSQVIDVHVHLTPPEIAADRGPWLAGEGPWTDMYQTPKSIMMSTGQLLAIMDEEGVDLALVCGFPWSDEDKAKRHNEWLMAQAARFPDRLRPMAAFDALAPWAARHAEAMLAAGHRGLGELALYDRGFGPRELDILAALGEICRENDSTMLLHVNEPIGPSYPGKAPLEMGQIYALVRRLSEVKLILAHFGGGLPFLAAQKKEVRESLANVRFDTAAMPFLYDPAAIPMALKVLGPEHFVLGTDCPLLPPSRYRRYFEAAGLSGAETEMIMGGSLQRFMAL